MEGQYMHGRIAGLYAVDRVLSEGSIPNIIQGIYAGQDALQLCAQAPCTAWTVDPLGVSPCANCERGKFQATAGSSACANCSTCQFSLAEGADSDVCQTCPSLSSSPASSRAGAACVCNAGAAGPAGGPCLSCPVENFTASAGQAFCTDCPANFSSAAGSAATECVACRAFSSSIVGHTLACLCLPGYGEYEVRSARACVACPSGTWTHGGFGVCIRCLLRADNYDTCNETVLVTGCARGKHRVPGGRAWQVHQK